MGEKTFNFSGYKSGDYESFCFDVEKSDYTSITQNKPSKFDKSLFHKGTYRIYPNDLLKDIESDHLYDFEITIKATKR